MRRHSFAALLAAAALVLGACSSDGGPTLAEDGPSTTAGTTSTPATATVGGANPCDQGATQDEVVAVPVAGVDSDLTITSFDGTELRVHWFPHPDASADDPVPTVLMGPGWSLAGDTSLEGGALFGALSIPALRDAGYHVLTWDPRGFGESGGKASVNDPELEGRDLQVLLDWVAAQPEAQTDDDGDPRVGMVGFSYGGGIQLVTAAIDCRVDAIVPGIAWHSLETSLFKSRTVKAGWASVLSNTGGGNVDPHITSASESGIDTGLLSQEDEDWFRSRGPGDLVDDITVPTLFVQGTVDTLFTLDEAITNHRSLRERNVPTAMLWFCGGHGTCLTDPGDPERVTERELAWLARYLDGDTTVDPGHGFETVDQNGDSWVADDLPVADETLGAQGRGTLRLTSQSTTGPPTGTPADGDPLSGLVQAITPGLGVEAVEVPITITDEVAGHLALGAPTLSIAYSGTSPDGEQPTRVFAQLVDDERQVVVGNQITPIEVVLDGEPHTVEVDLEVIAQHLEVGQDLTLQLVATTSAYATPRLGGQITFDEIGLSIPVVTKGLTKRS
jgi:ABC-2 type transport system ATP-binding protein